MSDITAIKEPLVFDETLQEYEYHEYEPITGANLNSSGAEIRINIETQDLFTHPSESYLLVEGRLQKNDGTAYQDADLISLVNNAIMYLFRVIRYNLSGQTIETLRYPGVASTMFGLLTSPDDFSKSQGLNQLWFKDSSADAAAENTGFAARRGYVIAKPVNKGSFSFVIPLKHIFGFAQDYDKLVYGFKHELNLVRDTDNDAVFRDAGVNEVAKIVLSKISWFVPHVMPSDETKLQLYKTIESKTKLDIGYRMRQCDSIAVPQNTTFSWRLATKASPEKPRWVIIAFQTDKSNDQEANPTVFDHCRLRNIYTTLNAQRYPAVDYNTSFPQNRVARVYKEAADFRRKFFNMDHLISNPNITPADFSDLYPLFVFDVSKQSERLKDSTVDIYVRAEFDQNVPANTQAFALVISDRILRFESDGQKMSVVF